MGDQPLYSPLSFDEATSKGVLTTLQKAELVRGLEVFSQATVEELYQLSSVAREVGYPAGGVIFRENDAGDAFFIVVRGQVELTCQESAGREVLGPGQAVGLYSVLTRELRCATAKALEDTVGICLGAEDFYNVLSNNTEMVTSIFKHFVQKLGLGHRT
jgi:potassium efflux system protein